MDNICRFSGWTRRKHCPDYFLPVRREDLLSLQQRRQFPAALAAYPAFLEQHPNDAGMWANFGVLLRALRHYPAAIACYHRALALRPNQAGVLSNLGNALKDCDRVAEALDCHQRAVALAPSDATLRLNHAVTLREAGQPQAALAILNDLLQLEDAPATWRWERALTHLHLGNFVPAWQDYEARWELDALRVPQVDCPRWQGDDLQHRHLLLTAEQGFGDTLLAARLVAPLKARYPTCALSLACQPELHALFGQLGVTLVHPAGALPAADYYCPLMSLPGLLAIDDHHVPPPAALHIPVAAATKFAWLAEHAPGRKKIGFVWSGSLTFKDNAKRATGLERFLKLAENPALQWYCLQKGPCQQDLQTHRALPLVCDLAGSLENFADTAAAVAHLDMVVMTDSALAHLAASLGKPVLNLLQYKPYWLYATDARVQAWYPSMQAIRQPSPGDWQSVFAQAEKVLAAL